MMNYKKKQIEGLRAVGLVMILIFHYGYRYFEIYGGPLCTILKYWGNMGCVLFFLISGFFIYRIDENSVFNVKQEIKKRIYKLWGPYVISISLIFLILHIWPLEGRMANGIEYVCNIFMINGFIGVNYVDGSHWYLSYLIAFTVLVNLLKYVKVSKKLYIYVVWLIVNSALFFIESLAGGVTGKILSVCRMLLGGDYAGAMIAGIILRQYIEDATKKNNKMLVMIGSVIFTWVSQNYYISIFMIICLIVLYLAYNNKMKFLENPLLVAIGTMSYYVYLVHQNIGYLILNRLSNWIGSRYYGAYLVIVIIVVAFFSILVRNIWIYIDDKAIKDILKYSRGHKTF